MRKNILIAVAKSFDVPETESLKLGPEMDSNYNG